MRYYLDTNILMFVLLKENGNIHFSIREISGNYSNLFYVSSVAVREVVFLLRIGKLKSKIYKTEKDILEFIIEFGIQIVTFNEKHLNTYLNLTISENHKDMNDHAIIAQAISDKIPLISSDRESEKHNSQGLFLFIIRGKGVSKCPSGNTVILSLELLTKVSSEYFRRRIFCSFGGICCYIFYYLCSPYKIIIQ